MAQLQVLTLDDRADELLDGNSGEIDVSHLKGDFLGEIVGDNNGGTTPTLDAIIQDSADGVTWFAWITFTQATDAAFSEVIKAARPCLGKVRVNRALGGTDPDYTYKVRLTGYYA